MAQPRFWIFFLTALCLQAAETPSEILNRQLPSWVKFGFDHRFRFEGYSALRYHKDNNDRWLLNRFRIDTEIEARPWLKFFTQMQDARVFFKLNPSGQEPLINRTDLRLAHADWQLPVKVNLLLRAGRQEFGYGENRLLGPANWGSVARSFDAIKLTYKRDNFWLDLAASSVVRPQLRGLSRSLPGNNLHFAYAHYESKPARFTVEPYYFWRIGRGDGNALRGIVRQDRRIPGFRFYGKLPASFDYATEWVLQRGNVSFNSVAEPIYAYAQHTAIGKTFPHKPWKPRIWTEYNSSTGDKDPQDGRSGTFDQIFPTPHEKYGLADQVGWQNIRHGAGGIEFTPSSRARLKLSYHNWHLDQARDGLYLAVGPLVYKDPTGQSGRHVGQEFDIFTQFTRGPHYIGIGYARLFPGEFLRNVSPGASLNYIFMNVGYRF